MKSDEEVRSRTYRTMRVLVPAAKIAVIDMTALDDVIVPGIARGVEITPLPDAEVDALIDKYVGVLLSLMEEFRGATIATLEGLMPRGSLNGEKKESLLSPRKHYEKMLADLPESLQGLKEKAERIQREKDGGGESEVRVLKVGKKDLEALTAMLDQLMKGGDK